MCVLVKVSSLADEPVQIKWFSSYDTDKEFVVAGQTSVWELFINIIEECSVSASAVEIAFCVVGCGSKSNDPEVNSSRAAIRRDLALSWIQ